MKKIVVFIFSIVVLGMMLGSPPLSAKDKPGGGVKDTVYPKGSDERGMFHADKDGKPLYPDKKIRFKEVGDYHEGVSWVLGLNGKYFFIDSTGKAINKKIYLKKPGDFINGFAIVINFNDDMVFVRKNGSQIPGVFFKVRPFVDGLAAIENYDGFCYHIDTAGVRAYKEKYEEAGDFKKGFARVKSTEDGKYLFIDKKGERLSANSFSKATEFDENGVAIARNGKTMITITVKDDGSVEFAMVPSK